MTILHLCKKYPNALGGDAVVVSSLQRQQEESGHKVVIVTSNCNEIPSSKHLYKIGLRDTPAKLDTITARRLLSLIALSFQMFAILRRERPSIIHAHSVDMTFFASFAARFYGVPIVHTFHIVTFYDTSQSFLRRKAELWLAKGAGIYRATAPNAYDVKKLQAAGLKQTTLLPNGVDLSFWGQSVRSEANQNFVFLSIGRLEGQKGYEHLIEAAALLAVAPPEKFQVILVGEGSQKATLQNLIEANQLEDIVTLVGHKSRLEIRTLLAQADAMVLPSLYETTPLTLLEAWASNIAVIATSVGILRDRRKDFSAAYVVQPKDEVSLMQAMSRCMTDGASRSAVAASGLKEAQQYDWPLVARMAKNIYRTTL